MVNVFGWVNYVLVNKNDLDIYKMIKEKFLIVYFVWYLVIRFLKFWGGVCFGICLIVEWVNWKINIKIYFILKF